MKLSKLAFIVLCLGATNAYAGGERARVDLDDLMIKGEIHNDDRLMILARQKNEMKNYVKFRTNFKDEMLQELPAGVKKSSL